MYIHTYVYTYICIYIHTFYRYIQQIRTIDPSVFTRQLFFILKKMFEDGQFIEIRRQNDAKSQCLFLKKNI